MEMATNWFSSSFQICKFVGEHKIWIKMNENVLKRLLTSITL